MPRKFQQKIGEAEEGHGGHAEEKTPQAGATSLSKCHGAYTADDDEHPQKLFFGQRLMQEEPGTQRNEHGIG